MIECVILPDGQTELPAEAFDDSVVWSHLSESNASPNSPVGSLRNVQRATTPERLVLRLPGSLDDQEQTTLDNITDALVGNINGLKVHPDGWQEVEP